MATDDRTRQADLTRMLVHRRRTILDGITQGVREAAGATSLARAGEVFDTVEEGEAMLQDAIRFALISMKTEMVVHIDRALQHLAEGSYGSCKDCGDDISEARLLAMPFAQRCVECEEQRENAERQRLWRSRLRQARAGELASR